MLMTPDDPESDADLMSRYDIVCVSVPLYQYKSWRYARLAGAVAQAKREHAREAKA
jgi:hypothetical protein